LIALELARDRGVGVQRQRGIPQLAGVELLERRRILASRARGELGGLLVALDERPLDFLLLCVCR